MTPKEKAKDLVDKFRNVEWIEEDKEIIRYKWIQCNEAKQCALIAVYEILESLGYKSLSDSPYTTLEARQYYVKVKQEIEKL